jgi:hypothetical protein
VRSPLLMRLVITAASYLPLSVSDDDATGTAALVWCFNRGVSMAALRNRASSRMSRWLATTVLGAMLAVLGVGGQIVTTAPRAVMAQAFATPAPGQPGGNHSDPGDNKHQKKPAPNRSNNGSRSSQGSDSNSDSQRRQPQSRIDATQIDQTDKNNRLTPDGDNRSTGIQTGSDGSARQAQPDQQPPDANPEQAAQRFDGIPPQRDLAPDVQSDYEAIRNASVPRPIRMEIQRAAENGDIEYNRDPFHLGETQLKPHADHLLPVRRFYDIPGFADLDRQTKLRFVNSPDNIIATTPQENTSRGASTYAEYTGLADGTPLDPAYRADRIQLENELYPQIVQRVNEAWAEQFPGRPLPSPEGPVGFSNGPLEVTTQSPIEVPLVQDPPQLPITAPELPAVQAPPELPPLQAPIGIPANPVPLVTNYPLPPVSPATPPIVGNPGPLVVGTPVAPAPAVLPPAVADPTRPPIGTPVVPLETLFPGIESAAPATLPEAIGIPAPVDPTTLPRVPGLGRLATELVKVPIGTVPFVLVVPPSMKCQANPSSCIA